MVMYESRLSERQLIEWQYPLDFLVAELRADPRIRSWWRDPATADHVYRWEPREDPEP